MNVKKTLEDTKLGDVKESTSNTIQIDIQIFGRLSCLPVLYEQESPSNGYRKSTMNNNTPVYPEFKKIVGRDAAIE